MPWIKEFELANSIGDFKTSQSITGRVHPDFEILAARSQQHWKEHSGLERQEEDLLGGTTGRSTSGGCMLWGSHPIKMWSRTQALVSLSSAEAELYAAIKACSETLGFLSLLKDYQIHATGKIMSDASAALDIIKRQGLGRTRHIHTSYLWIQQVNERGINFSKISGTENCADLFTKPLTRESAEGHDEIAFTINFMGQSGHHLPSLIQSSLQNLGLRGMYFIWPRMDLRSKCFRTSAKGGPSWKDVEARVTMDASGHVIKVEAARDITRECENRLLPGGPCDIVTLLIWKIQRL